jgi:hypothetical protein
MDFDGEEPGDVSKCIWDACIFMVKLARDKTCSVTGPRKRVFTFALEREDAGVNPRFGYDSGGAQYRFGVAGRGLIG